MTRSKIFLGVTTSLLAVAGVAAAKHYGPATQRWYVTAENLKCIQAPAATCVFKASGNKTCTINTVRSGIQFHLPIYTQGAVGPKVNCKTVLLYTRAD